MAYESTIARRSLESRARRARQHGQVPEDEHPVKPMDEGGVALRDEGRFFDQSGLTIIGMTTWGSATWGGTP